MNSINYGWAFAFKEPFFLGQEEQLEADAFFGGIFLENLLQHLPLFIIFLIFCSSLFLLSKSADYLTDQAILLSKELKVPDTIIGATIVSLGTSLPEFATSVTAVFSQSTVLALGNSLGSVITNISLIFGVGILYGSMPAAKKSANNLFFLVGSLFLLFLPIVGQKISGELLQIPKPVGWLLVMSLPIYLYFSFKKNDPKSLTAQHPKTEVSQNLILRSVGKLLLSAIFVALSSTFLVASVQIAAKRIGISEAIISATVVALGTSLPELSTTIISAKKGYGGLAFGNIIGASLMNVLLVLSTTIILSKGAITVPANFLFFNFPIAFILLFLILFGLFSTKKQVFSKKDGVVFLSIYAIYLFYNLFLAS